MIVIPPALAQESERYFSDLQYRELIDTQLRNIRTPMFTKLQVIETPFLIPDYDFPAPKTYPPY